MRNDLLVDTDKIIENNKSKDINELVDSESNNNLNTIPTIEDPEIVQQSESVGEREIIGFSDNPFDTAVRLSQGDINYALTKYKGITPEIASKVKQIADKDNVNFDTVLQDKDQQLEYEKAQNVYDSLYETTGGDYSYLMPELIQQMNQGELETPVKYKYPYTVQYLEDPTNLISSKDDIRALQELEYNVKKWDQKDESFLTNLNRSLNYGTLQLAEGLLRSPAIAQSLAKDVGISFLGLDPTKYSIKPSSIFLDNSMLDGIEELSKKVMPIELQESIVDSVKKGNYLEAANISIQKAVSNAPNSVIAMAGAITGNPMASFGIIGALAGGMAYKQKLEQGGTDRQALVHSIFAGGFEGLYESVGTVFMFKGIEKRIAREVGPFASKKFFEMLGYNAVLSAGQNIVEETLTQISQDFSDKMTGNDRAFMNYADTLLETAIVAGVSGVGMGTTMYTASSAMQANRNRRQLKIFNTQQEVIKQSSLAPENTENFLDGIVDQNNLEDKIFVENEAFVEYFQDKPKEFEQLSKDMELGDLVAIEQYGLDVQLDSKKLLAKYSDNQLTEDLKPFFKFGDNGISVKGKETIDDIMVNKIEDFNETFQKTKPATIQDIPQLVEMRNKLVSEQGYKVQDADAVLNVQLEGARTLSQKTGETVNDWYNRVNPVLNIGEDVVSDLGQGVNRKLVINNLNPSEKGVFDTYSPDNIMNAELAENITTLDKTMNKPPEDEITIYRGAVSSQKEIVAGDFITTNKQLAKDYAGTGKVLEKKVRLKDILDDSTESLGEEYLYYPKDYKLQQDVTQTPAFKQWFRDSKVVDEQGKPLVVYHGTSDNIKIFKKEKSGSINTLDEYGNFYFTDDIELAKEYSRKAFKVKNKKFKNEKIIESYLKLENPFIIDNDSEVLDVDGLLNFIINGNIQSSNFSEEFYNKILDFLGEDFIIKNNYGENIFNYKKIEDIKNKFDSVIIRNAIDTLGSIDNVSDIYIVFDPTQIKSVKNVGTFDATNPNIYKQDKRGGVKFTDTQTIISLYKDADYSTFIHETSHIFSKEMQRIDELGLGDEQFGKDFQAIKDFVGGEFNIENEEKFARAFESYVREGKAPSIKLASAFERFKSWLTKIYESVKGLDIEINDDIRAVFDRMLSSKQDIDNAKTYYNLRDSLYDGINITNEEKKQLKKRIDKTLEESQRLELKKRLKALNEATSYRSELIKQSTSDISNQLIYKAIEGTIDAGGVAENDMRAYVTDNDIQTINRKHSGYVNLNVMPKQAKAKKYSSIILKNGGINPQTLTDTQKKELKEADLFTVLRKNGRALDDIAQTLENNNQLFTPENRNAADYLWELLITRQEYTLQEDLTGIEQQEGIATDNDLLEIASAFKYDDVKTMLDDVKSADNKQTMINELVNAREKILEKNILEDIQANEVVLGEESLHNDKSLEWLISEQKILENKLAKETKRQFKQIEKQAIIDTAKNTILNKQVKDAISYNKFLNTERRLSDDVVKYIKDGNIEKALESKRKQILNHAMVRESIAYRDIVLKNKKKYQVKNVRKISARLENNYNDIYINTLQDLGFIDYDKIKTSSNMRMTDFKNINTDFYLSIPKDIIAVNDNSNVNTFIMSKYLELMDTLHSIESIGKDALEVLKTDKINSLKELEEKTIANMDNLKNFKQIDEKLSSIIKGARKAKDYFFNHIKMTEFLFNRLDNYNLDGEMNEVFTKLTEKQVLKDALISNFSNKLSTQFSVLDDFAKRMSKTYKNTRGYFDLNGVAMPQFTKDNDIIKSSWSAEKIISYVLNLGNEGNIEALQNSYGFTQKQTDIITSQLNTKEILAIQDIWNETENMYPMIDDVHFKMFNRHMGKVTRKPIRIKTSEGTILELDGGYYPLVYDRDLSAKAEDISMKSLLEEEVDTNRYNAVIRKVSPKDGFKKNRSQGVAMPPRLSLSVLSTHVQDVSRFVAYTEILNEVNKLTLNKDWKSKFVQKEGKQNYYIMREYLASLASAGKSSSTGVEKGISWLNGKSTVYMLSSLKIGVSQGFSIYHAVRELGDNNTINGMKYLIQGYQQAGFLGSVFGLKHIEAYQNILKVSGYFKARDGNWDTAVIDAVSSMKGKGFKFDFNGKKYSISKKELTQFMLMFLKNRDRATVMPVWYGGFQKYMDKNVKNRKPTEADFSKAVTYADRVVRRTQPSALKTDLNAFQRDKGVTSLFTKFMTYTFKFGNIMMEQGNMLRDRKITKLQYMNSLFQDLLLPAMSMLMLNSLWYDGKLPDKKNIFFAPISFLFSPFPLIRDISSSIKYRRPIGSIPAFSGIDMIVKLGENLYKVTEGRKELEDVIFKDLVNVTEYLAGTPIVKNYRQIKNVFDNIEEL